ncbi:MAG TPA: hypothetical protein VFP15_15430 [Gemmatimonadaceae bacterium]|nr:hypothetical protein [Gemmatimonadaceae bacterium]
MISPSRWAALFACAITSAGCRETRPARIEVPSDTVTVNSTLFTPVGIRVLDEHGETLPDTLIHYAVADTSILGMGSHDLVNCHDDGTTVITATSGDISARVVIRCRVVRRFGAPQIVELVAGGPPASLDIVALDSVGNVMSPVRLQATISDSTVIALRNGEVYGLKPGYASIDVGSWGRTGGAMFFVKAPKDTSDSLARGSAPLQRATSLNRP